MFHIKYLANQSNWLKLFLSYFLIIIFVIFLNLDLYFIDKQKLKKTDLYC